MGGVARSGRSAVSLSLLIAASLSVLACGGGSSAPPTTTPLAVVPTLTPTLALTPPPVPTPTPVPTGIATGTLTGDLLSNGKHAPVSGAGVILCLKSASGCTTDANLQAISDSSGKFKIDGVPEGNYVVLYSPSGAPGSSASGLDVALDDQTAHCLGVAFAPIGGSVSDSCSGSIPFFDDSMLRALSAQIANVSDSGPLSDTSFESGRVCSSKYGLCLDFEASTPVTAEITAGSTTSVKVTVG
jgi:hypothetical protein